jgi:hypothetical protein
VVSLQKATLLTQTIHPWMTCTRNRDRSFSSPDEDVLEITAGVKARLWLGQITNCTKRDFGLGLAGLRSSFAPDM